MRATLDIYAVPDPGLDDDVLRALEQGEVTLDELAQDGITATPATPRLVLTPPRGGTSGEYVTAFVTRKVAAFAPGASWAGSSRDLHAEAAATPDLPGDPPRNRRGFTLSLRQAIPTLAARGVGVKLTKVEGDAYTTVTLTRDGA